MVDVRYVQIDCARKVCKSRNITHYNHSTGKGYCPKCARLINDANRVEAMKLYGHDLCTPIRTDGNEE